MQDIQRAEMIYDPTEMLIEVSRLRRHMATFQTSAKKDPQELKNWSALELLSWILKWHLQESVPNLSVAIRIFFNNNCISS